MNKHINQYFPDVFFENEGYEYKIKLNRDDVGSWLKTLVGFANYLLV